MCFIICAVHIISNSKVSFGSLLDLKLEFLVSYIYTGCIESMSDLLTTTYIKQDSGLLYRIFLKFPIETELEWMIHQNTQKQLDYINEANF